MITINNWEILLISIGLSMDAFAVSICKGLAMKRINYKRIFIIGFYFGFFQALMPFLGYMFGSSFGDFIIKINHWLAFILLSLIGINMIKETVNPSDNYDDNISFKSMIIISIATSIDAFTVGITFSFLKVNIYFSLIIIGIITFLFSSIGVFIGNKIGVKYEKIAQIIGGVILILMGIKILLEHLNA